MNLTNYTQIEQAREDVKAHPRGDAVRDQARVRTARALAVVDHSAGLEDRAG